MSETATVERRTVSFNGGGDFYSELKTRVGDWVNDPKRARRAHVRLYSKTAFILLWTAASWAGLMFWASSWWHVVLLAISLGLALAGIGFNVTHDANHGSYSPNRKLNGWMRWSMDVIGASSYVWRIKHNVVHHTYTNIEGHDSDIEQLPFLRLGPEQKHRPMHRFQHIYAWPLYGLFAVKWQLLSDLTLLSVGKVGETPLPWPQGREKVGFWLGKAIFATWAIILPVAFHWGSIFTVLIAFGIASFVLAFVLAITFQLAHCVEEAEFSTTEKMAEAGKVEWARHQVETTVDFAPRSRILAWYMGGLNFQIEHHLFSRVAHTHYPKIAPIVQEVCARYGVDYQVHQTLRSAVMSHIRFLARMGQPNPGQSGAHLPV